MTQHNPFEKIRLTNPIHFLALGFGSGLMKKAPGTWGSVVGVLFGFLLLNFLSIKIFLILTALFFVIGCYLCQKTADDMGVHDHGAIVWDEIVGIFIVLSAIPVLSWQWMIVAFVLFRFFDILKPFPIRYFDQKLESGLGIMVDDVLAAIYSVILIFFIRLYF
ncbi:phosphatidylglycerophosphatase A [Rodentibacter caecimuris]|uniref:Phosphatidylglycerophosphatase A n=1 Tax=Rodentibacter caecimuris TaxID=1796644 RepID=A0ABX3KW92_9PAST|nr:phosphatidylglycerophosphatase A [Rodentibacter heylii]